ncbi:MAG: GspH/FimT family pseudopilin [gamma proteobacterium symbiont of Bathyaustriella thionipta]|nr:GspH/FimT family pseudopilin [gamma proteobacterium symbiont of Bathyaustriella thionipta]MCU7949519.1 GspH/FimT family pseudopilin [gamma proteobacterium symbiont of Bathyaustriella thionipta]MCU7954154.1 GspH/FimT family pseudopilin [gamma proteobacterium symbiont of Bathyaustriella thionipta]MCU7956105.1 GspH/FimT family pseudopilin [gamma proteobacterium symbiont of Bathyaustriella thionipta]MCU7967567.1 GspH/FimT family pseudopilin [gamma proteobacterium symbiont of Bathyaustriella thio
MKKLKGFTLIELMITLAVAAILLTVAVPMFTETLRKNRLSAQASNMFTALNVARSEAIKMGTDVTVCSTINQVICGGAVDWSTGWMVRQGAPGGPGPVIKVWDALSPGSALLGDAGSIVYTSRGMTDPASGAAGTLQLTLTPTVCKPNERRRIDVNSTGRSMLSTINCP